MPPLLPRAIAGRPASPVRLCDPFVRADFAALHAATEVEIEELLRVSDFVSLHVPVTETTWGMIGAARLRAMKPGVFFIDTVALDVFAVEPPGWTPASA